MGEASRRRLLDPQYGQALTYEIRIWEAWHSHEKYSPYLEIPFVVRRQRTYKDTQIRASAVAGTIMGCLAGLYEPAHQADLVEALGVEWIDALGRLRGDLPSSYYALVAVPGCYEGVQYLGADIRECGTPTVFASEEGAIPGWAVGEFDRFDMSVYLEKAV
jgi:hypothetical protein